MIFRRSDLTQCKNVLCGALVAIGIEHCCGGCRVAREGGYEIHEGGDMLSHSEGCIQRQRERAKFRTNLDPPFAPLSNPTRKAQQ